MPFQQVRGAGVAVVAIGLAAVAAKAQRQPAGDEVVEHRAQGEVVAARVGQVGVAGGGEKLFRRLPVGGARVAVRFAFAEQAVSAEIGQLDAAAARIEQQVGRLQVEIAPAILVYFGERLVDLPQPGQGLREIDAAAGIAFARDMFAKVAVEQFERHHGQVFVNAAIQQSHDVAFVPWLERTQEGDFLVGAGNPAVALGRFGARHLLLIDQFEGGLAAGRQGVGAPHDPVGRAGERLAQAIAARFQCDDRARLQHASPDVHWRRVPSARPSGGNEKSAAGCPGGAFFNYF